MKKIISLVLALVMILLVGIASAATITINRDDTWDPNAKNAEATYTYYKIFDAAITTAATVDEDTGENTTDGVVVYTISGTNAAAKVAALPSIFTAKEAADGKYYITLTSSSTTAADIVDALSTMVKNNSTLFPGTAVTSDEDPVVIDGLTDAYYLILASNGKNAAVQTIGDVEIKEKNDYPGVSKEQKKAADPTYTEAVIPAEIGTYHDFKITVTIPEDANKAMAIIDKMTAGLDYDEDTGLTLSPALAYSALTTADEEYDADATWQIKFSADVVQANAGTDVVITYRALITEDCLVDTGRENEVTLSYDDNHYVLVDKTNYTTYFGGIEKVDGANTEKKLEGVKFTVTVDDKAYNVTPVKKGGDGEDKDEVLYYIPGGESNEVVTGKNGLVIIRGLDNEKTYTLTEKETNEGYNLLETPKDLTLKEDKGTAYSTANYDQVLNNQGVQLPSTGGIGTTIFYIVGGLLLVGAAVILVARRKAQD